MESHTFRVRYGWNLKHNSELIITPESVRLGERELKARDIKWIKWQTTVMFHTGVKTGTSAMFALGGEGKPLTFSLHDALYSKKNTSPVRLIRKHIFQFFGLRIIDSMIETIASGGTFGIGKARFQREGALLPRKGLIFSGDLEFVPWLDIACTVEDGAATIYSVRDKPLRAREDLWKTPNACLVEAFAASVQMILASPD